MFQKQKFISKQFNLQSCDINFQRLHSVKHSSSAQSFDQPSICFYSHVSPRQNLQVETIINLPIPVSIIDNFSLTPLSDPRTSPKALQDASKTQKNRKTFFIHEFLCFLDYDFQPLKRYRRPLPSVEIKESLIQAENRLESSIMVESGWGVISINYCFQIVAQIQNNLLLKINEKYEEQEKIMDTKICTDFSQEDYSTEIHSKTDFSIDSKKCLGVRKAIQKNVRRGDKKNVVKNFVKAFRGYLVNWGNEDELMKILGFVDQEQLDKARYQWQQYENQQKYNNQLIKSLILESQFKKIFKFFLKNRAEEWLLNSGVQDKESHAQVLQGYIKACEDEYLVQNIVCLKSRYHRR